MLKIVQSRFLINLTEIIKLHQVCNGFTKNDDGEVLSLHNSKLNALDEILEETDGKVIIWANYIYNIEQLIEFLEKKYGKESVVSIYGAVDVQTRKDCC